MDDCKDIHSTVSLAHLFLLPAYLFPIFTYASDYYLTRKDVTESLIGTVMYYLIHMQINWSVDNKVVPLNANNCHFILEFCEARICYSCNLSLPLYDRCNVVFLPTSAGVSRAAMPPTHALDFEAAHSPILSNDSINIGSQIG